MADLMERAGVVAKRLLAERRLIYLNDLNPDDCNEVLKQAWREAARDPFRTPTLAELYAEINEMIESLIPFPQPGVPKSALHGGKADEASLPRLLRPWSYAPAWQ